MLKQIISLFLTVVMVISMLPVQAIALETEPEAAEQILETEPVVEETEDIEQETEPTVEQTIPEKELNTHTAEETKTAAEETEPAVEETEPEEAETESAEEETEPAEVETEPAAEETGPTDAETESAEEELPVLEKIETDPMLADGSNVVSGTCGDDLTWALDEEGTLTISGTGAMTDYASFTDLPFEPYRAQITTVVIADGITSIGDKVFNGCDNLTSITIPGSVTSIGANAFAGCDSIASIELPVGVTTIKTLAFDSCQSLRSVTIPDGVTEIGVHAFRNCGALEEITIPGTVTHIEEKTFEDCDNLVTVTIEEGVTSIGERAFDFCYALTNVSLPDSMEDIASYAFHSCTSLQSIVIPEGITSINQCVFGGCSSLTNIDLPDSLCSIGDSAFVDCSSLTSIDIPDSVTTIGASAFMGCGGLQSIIIPAGVASIESGTFYYCENLKEIVFAGDAPTIAEDAFYAVYATVARYNADNTTWTKDVMQDYEGYIIWLPIGQATSGTCGENLTWAMDEYFSTIIISGSGPMYDYSSENPAPWNGFADYVYQVDANESEITTVGNYAFAGMTGISTVVLPDTVVCIGEGAFSCNDTLQGITIPAGVAEMEKDAFADCAKLSKVTFTGNAPTVLNPVFSDTMTFIAFYPSADTSWTEAARNSFGGNVTWYAKNEDGTVQGTCGEGLSWIFADSGRITISGTGEMYDYSPENPAPWSALGTSIQYLTVESGVESIGAYAFSGLTQLGYAFSGFFPGASSTASNPIDLPASVEKISEGAFSGCSSLKKLVFQGDAPSEMADIIFSDDMTLSAYYPCENATWTEEVRKDYGGHVTWCGVDAGGNEMGGSCGTSVKWRYDPASATLTISGSGAMSNYTSYSGVPKTPWDAWKTEIEKVVIETGVTHLGSSAFRKMTALKDVQIPDTVASIGAYTFAGCSSLSLLQLPDSVTQIGNYAFSGCTDLALQISAGVTSMGTGAIQGVKTVTVDADNEYYTVENGLLLSKDKTILFGSAVQQESYLIPDTVTCIAEMAFSAHPAMFAVTIPANVKTIGYAAFAGCSALVNVTIQGKLTEIADSAFADSTLTSIWFQADAPEYIYETAFTNVSSNAYYPMANETWTETVMQSYGGNLIWMPWNSDNSGTCGDNLTWMYDVNRGTLIISGSGAMTDYSAENPAPWTGFYEYLYGIVLEPGVTSIGNYAFEGVPSVAGMTLPDSLKKIGEGAFSGSGFSMTQLIIPAGVNEIGTDAFCGCTGFSRIAFQGGLPVLADTLFSEDMTLIATYPEGNTTWTDAAFKNYGGNLSWFARDASGNLVGTCGEGLTWSYKLTSGWGSNNSKLTISGNGKMTDYSPENPAPWSGLGTLVQNLTIESGVESIGDYAFAGMTKLGYASSGGIWPGATSSTSNIITLPASVEKIGENAFSGCSSLKKIHFLGNAPEFAETIFSENMTLTLLYRYDKEGWTEDIQKNYGGNVTWCICDEEGKALEGTCGDNARWFYDLESATLTFSGSGDISGSGWSAWKTKVEKVVIGSGITWIMDATFSNCTNLKQITIPDTVTSIGSNAFQNCSNLALSIPASVTEIGTRAVRGVKSLTVNAANEAYAAENGLLLNKEKTTVLSYAVSQDSYEIPGTVTTIGEEAFCEHPSLTSVILPENITSLGYAAFAGCTYLECVTVEGKLSEIGEYAFASCNSLAYIRFKGDAPGNVNENAFDGVGTYAYYPESNMTYTDAVKQICSNNLSWEPWQAPTSGTCGDNLTWTYADDGSITISGTGEMTDYSASGRAPWSDLAYSVYAILMEPGVTSIGDYAFADMPYLEYFELPDDLERIGESAFSGCSSERFASLVIPAGVEQIGKNAFAGCTNLTQLTFRGDMPAMEAPLFSEDMTVIVKYPAENVTWADLEAEIYGGNWYAVDANGNYIGTCGTGLSWTLKSNRLTISGNGAMDDYSPEKPAPWSGLVDNLRFLTIESGVTSIGSYAFAGMINLGNGGWSSSNTNVVLPDTIGKIGESAFYGCTSLARIDFQGNLPNMPEVIFSGDMVLACYYSDGNTTWTEDALQNYGGSVQWYRRDENGNDLEGNCGENAVWNYDPDAFALTITGSGAMNDYSTGSRNKMPWSSLSSEIEKAVIGSDITTIGDYSFNEMPALKAVVIPDTVERIGNSAFAGCSNLILNIPAGVSDIGSNAVQGVKSFSVDSENEIYASDNGLLLNKAKTEIISYAVPKETYTIPETVTAIADYAFENCTSLTEISIPDGVQYIGVYAFSGCTNLTEANIPSGVTYLNTGIFSGTALTTIVIPENVENIYDSVFYGCEKLEHVVFAEESKVRDIGSNAFAYCTSLKTIELPASANWLTGNTFAYSGLTKIWLPANVQHVSYSIFAGCADLETVVFEGNLIELGNSVFYGCNDKMTIRFLGNAPTNFADYAFDGLSGNTVYYPEDNSTWTADVLQTYGGYVNWAAWESASRGTCGDDLTWQYDEWNNILSIFGTGAMMDYEEGTAPWNALSIKLVEVTEGVTSIGSYAFVDTDASQIDLPEGLVTIDEYALPRKLTHLNMPESLTAVFTQDLVHLERFSIAAGNEVFTEVDGVLFSKDMTQLLSMPACWVKDWNEQSFVEYIVPDTVTEICDSAFENCDFLRNIVLPDDLEVIGDNAISCLGTGTVDGPERIVIPKNVVSIGENALPGVRLVVFTGDAPAMAENVFSACTKTAYYPADNDTWTEDKLQDYGGDLTWIPYESEMPTSGIMSDTIGWNFDEDTATLIISGTGVMSGYHYAYHFNSDFVTPWLHLTDRIKHVVVEEGITEIGNRIFKNHYMLETVTLPDSLRIICDSAFYNNPALREVALNEGLITIEQGAFSGCSALESIRIPDTVSEIGAYAFFNCAELKTVKLSESLEYINTCTFAGCMALEEIRIPESVIGIGDCAFEGVTATVFYPADSAGWTANMLRNYGGTLTWIPVSGVENRVVLTTEELDGQNSVWIDGKEYATTTSGERSWVDLSNGNAKTLVVYRYGQRNGKQYPVGMKVWKLRNEEGFYIVERVEELDDILLYEGCSIRVTGNQGIRMITSVDEEDKAALTGQGLAGYTLKEYGTAIAWASQISANKPLTLGKSYVSSNYAYSRDAGKDPIFAYVNDRVQYTNVMVGFTLDQCEDDIAMRPYIILEDAQGNEITLYGGIVERSIGYIAAQNHDAFEEGTDAYNYVWKIITHVYGEDYVPES